MMVYQVDTHRGQNDLSPMAHRYLELVTVLNVCQKEILEGWRGMVGGLEMQVRPKMLYIPC